MEQARAVIAHRGGPEAIDHLGPNIEWLQLPAAGIDNWIEAGLLTSDRVNTNASPAYADTVAEHVILLILASLRSAKTAMRATSWDDIEITPFAGSTVMIVGAGRIGRAVIRRLQGFGVTVTASNRSGRPVDGASVTVRAGEEHQIDACRRFR